MPKSEPKATLPPPSSSSSSSSLSSRLLVARKPLQLFSGIVRSTRRFLVTMNLRGGNRQARTSKKKATIPPGQSELEQLLELAEYELDHDPYRGIGIPDNITTPWNQCTWGMLQETLTNAKDPSPEVVLRHVCQCACPSLIAWTKQQQKQKAKSKSKKRSRNEINRDIFQVGARGVNAMCICDFNPLCLGSLGGLINNILQERSDQVFVAYTQDKETPPPPPLPPPPASKHPKIIDLDADTTQSTGTSLSEDKDPLEFTGEEGMSTTKLEPLAIAPPPFKTKKRDSSLENPSLVFTKEHSTSDDQIITYSKTTQESLDRLRRSLPVQDAPIRSYIYRTLQIDHTNGNNVTLDSYVQKLRQWHKSLLFVNPMKDDDDDNNNNNNNNAASNSSNRLSISIPPGIQNLGATCYLNTQLQCLAQNTAFLQGIFSWRQATSSDEHGSMNSVMSKLQYLLAQMVVGGDGKLSTLDFSNALGLEHDEQQDPNEFARLLFQRMDESFNNCGDSNLSNLLQRLFHGVTTYETTCMTCQATSARQEGFMDLNLPIVQETKATTKTATKNGGQISILEALKGTKDTNVQYCLDQYTCAEMLNEDNQYHCSSCNAKRDAQRVLKFTELPPILNIQLSRYVFDREKCIKKKLTDKVLLPTVLNASKKKYLLCAVMRHQGTSAYRGHYVAEAMDWLTGQWFEFNDANVKLLPDGPSRSYDPTTLAEGESTTKKKLEGSQDAYNMYYVEDSFLAKHATSSLLKRESLLERVNKSSSQQDDEEESKDVLVKVAKQRDTKYAVLSELCFADWRKCDRLNRRREGIREFMFQGAASLAVVENGQNGKKDELPVWVDGAFLRTFLCCSKELDQHLSDSGPLLRHKHLLCNHGGLHPKTARRGKLLPRPIYDAYVLILQGERALLRQEVGESDADMEEMNDCLVTRDSHMHCQECSKSYQDQLSKKLDLVKDLKFLYEELDPKVDDFLSEYAEDDPPASPEDEYAYAISKGSITKFRRAVVGMMKTLHNLDDGTTLLSQENASRGPPPVVYEGLDALDTSMFEFEPADENGERILSSSESSVHNDDKLDEEVNGIITCSHGKCNLFRNKRLVRFVHSTVWSRLKKIFPRAIEHKEKRTLANGDKSSEDNGCPECELERASKDLLRTELENWATETKENFDLKVLYGGKSAISREKEVHNFTNGKNGVRLVHGADIKTWRDAVSTLADPSKLEATHSATLKSVVEDIVFPSYHRVVLEFERLPVERLLSSLRSLVCGEHKLVIKCAVFQDIENPPVERDSHKKQLVKNITVLSDDEYRAYIASLADLLRILNTEESFVGSIGSPLMVDDVKKPSTFLKEIRQVTESYHPTIRLHVDDDNDKPGNSLIFSLDGSDKVFELNPRLCVCETCRKEFAPLPELDTVESASVDEKLERVSVDANGSVSSGPTGSSKHGSAAADPILVESDHDDGADALPNPFNLRVFEISRSASIEDVTNSLQSVTAITSEAESSTLSNFIRRSTRKRKSKYPNGCLLSEDTVKVSLYHNIAALRLRLYEKCEVGLSGNKLILVVLGEDGKLAESLEIQFDWGPKQLSELVDGVKARTKIVGKDFEPAASLILLHQKQYEADSRSLHETVMDSLLEIANLDPSGPIGSNNNNGKTKRINNRPAERGFRGTLLSSGSAPKSDQNEEVVEKKAVSDAYAVSDEDKDDLCAVVEDSSPKKASLLSDSSSEDELPPSAFPPKDTNKRKREYQEAPKSPKVIVENDSSEDERRAVCSLQGLPVSGSENSVDSSRRRRTSQKAANDLLTEEVVAALQKIVEQPAEVVKAWDAASWAIMQNPSIKDLDGLVDIAFAKYLDNQS